MDRALHLRADGRVDQVAADLRAEQHHLLRRAPVHMHLVIAPPARPLHGDQHRGKGRRDRRGGLDHVVDQAPRIRVARGGDRPDVPDHRARGVEIGRADEQDPVPAIGLGDGAHHVLGHVALDQPAVAARVKQGRAAGQAREDRRREQVLGGVLRVDLSQGRVVFRPEKGEDGDDRAGGDAAHRLEAGAVAARRPAREQTRAERAVRPPARQREGGHPHGLALGDLGAVRGLERTGAQRDDGVDRPGVEGVAPDPDQRCLHAVGARLLERRLGHRRADENAGAGTRQDEEPGEQPRPRGAEKGAGAGDAHASPSPTSPPGQSPSASA